MLFGIRGVLGPVMCSYLRSLLLAKCHGLNEGQMDENTLAKYQIKAKPDVMAQIYYTAS